MCVFSAIGDYARDNWPQRYPYVVPWTDPNPNGIYFPPVPAPTKEQFDALKREVEALKKLLGAAKEYDDITHQPDCESAEKIELIRRVAEFVGVDLKDVLE